jgi:three-Cys-motif partner protein
MVSSMAQDAFAGPHTVKKLDKVEDYLRAFLSVFKNKSWANKVYFDAFAGTGQVPVASDEFTLPLGEEDRAFIIGSVGRALNLELSFDEYVFVEKKRKKAQELEQRLKAEHPGKAHLIKVRTADANDAIREFCDQPGWTKRRAVVFLDPCGSQVSWKTLELLAATEKIDLWYLFPAGLGVTRQIGKSGTVHETHGASLDRLLGTEEWRHVLIKTEEPSLDLFGESHQQKFRDADAESVTRFMIERMGMIFKGGVLDVWLPLGSDNIHKFSLLFACANPSPTASKLALKLARAVMMSGKHGRAK